MKKKKTCLKNAGQPSPTRKSIDPWPDWPDPTQPTGFAMSTKYNWFICLIKANKHYTWIVTWIVKTKEYIEPCHEDSKHYTWIVRSEEYDDKYYSEKINESCHVLTIINNLMILPKKFSNNSLNRHLSLLMLDTIRIDFVDEMMNVFNNRDLLKCALRAYISKHF